MDIIIGNKSERFKPHFNRATGKRYHTSKDYVADVKRLGLEPYRGEVKKKASKPYVASKQVREMVNCLGKGKPGGRYMEALNKMNKVKAVPKGIPTNTKGGWY